VLQYLKKPKKHLAYYPEEKETGNSEVKPVRDTQATMQTKGSHNRQPFFYFQLLVNLYYICTIILYKNSYL
jgi:hypothetical protein